VNLEGPDAYAKRRTVNTAIESLTYDPAHDRLADPRTAREWRRPSEAALVSGGDVRLVVAPDGRMRYVPASGDVHAIAELVAAETLLAQVRGIWPRLRTCANPLCGVCFYDTSPNRSLVWHDTRTCGNLSILRASRARRRRPDRTLRPRCASP
jgi:predicted RNA-binding Zn ribbon-like protein